MAETESNILLSMYDQYWEEIRHTENQRATLTNLIMLVSSATVGLLVDRGPGAASGPLGGLLILLGTYGSAITLKLYERHRFIKTRLDHLYRQLDELNPGAKFLERRAAADDEHGQSFPRLRKVRVHHLWLLLHVAIALTGVLAVFGKV